MRQLAILAGMAACVISAWPAAAQTAAQQRAIDAIRLEPKVKDVMWKSGIFYAGVLDDGTRRDGYAQYLCQVFRDHGAAKGVTVVVTDIAAIASRGEWRKLGRSHCD